MGEGFCPYCAHQNPSDFRFCASCRRPLPVAPPIGAEGSPAAQASPRPSSPVATPRPPGPASPSEELPPASPDGAGWGLIVLTVAIVVIVLLAGLYALGRFPGLTNVEGPPPPTAQTVRVDLCNASLGVDCTGNEIVLPVSSGGTLQNHSACDAVPVEGPSESVQLNFSTSAAAEGAVIPQPSFLGAGGFSADPPGFLANRTDRSISAWESGNVTGTDTATVQLPSGGSSWCVVWYAPPAGATITWTGDVAYSYTARR